MPPQSPWNILYLFALDHTPLVNYNIIMSFKLTTTTKDISPKHHQLSFNYDDQAEDKNSEQKDFRHVSY